ncbi:DUF1573 domain-containing protein [Aureliella helgolandensis]|uniref:DUF1573 domain-containing protein n=1 Tax=Aureliella helgolandensis TaxID=2527968 RepID=A0A518G5R5_9BACT|nr:DUF1573 domain-containing protein [Aureliella helgolandensis]QDV23932.1 hypothetical protein Q31a_22420 [Aureliella helgolandensis]
MRPLANLCAAAAVCVTSTLQLPSLEAQDWLPQAIPANQRVHDFGSVARSANTEHRFYLKNPLQSDIHIRSIRASCGCTTPIVETETIAPGETGSILARFNTGTFTGQKAATLTVSIDKPFFTELQLNVKGYIRSDIVLSPGEASFGQVPEGEPKVIELTLDYAGRSDWMVKDITSPVDFVTVDFEESARGGGRVQYKITATLAADAPEGFLQNQLVLHTNDRRLTTVPLALSGKVESALQVSPTNFALGEVQFGDPIEKRLVVKGREPFKILEMTSEIVDIEYETSDEAKPAHLLNLILSPKAQVENGKISGELLLKTDLREDPVKIKVSFDLRAHSPTVTEPGPEFQAAN